MDAIKEIVVIFDNGDMYRSTAENSDVDCNQCCFKISCGDAEDVLIKEVAKRNHRQYLRSLCFANNVTYLWEEL